MATDPKPDTQTEERPEETGKKSQGGVKSYAAPENTGGGPGISRIVTFVVIAVAIALLLFWLL